MMRLYQSYCDNNIRIFDEPVDGYKLLLCTRHIIGDGMLQKSQQQQVAIGAVAGSISYHASRKYSMVVCYR